MDFGDVFIAGSGELYGAAVDERSRTVRSYIEADRDICGVMLGRFWSDLTPFGTDLALLLN